jgi:hypothetical protein
MDFDAVVTGDREVALHFAQFPQRLHDKLLERIQKLTMKLYVRVVQLAPMDSAAPSGLHLPQEFVSIIKNHTDSIEGVVTMPKGLPQREYIKAGAMEYGVNTEAQMTPYMRLMSQAFGRPVTPRDILIGAYPRKMNMESRRYLRDALEGMEAEAVAEFTDALNEAIGE